MAAPLVAVCSKGVADVWIRGLKTGHCTVSGTDTDPARPRGNGPSPSPSTRAKGPRHYGTVMRSYGVTVSVIVASTVPATLAVTLAVWAPGVAFCGVAMVSVSLALAPAASVKLDGLESACVTGCDAVNVPADRTMISDALLVFVTSSEHVICDPRAAVQLIVCEPLHVSVAAGVVVHVPACAEAVPVADVCHPGAADAAVALSASAAGMVATTNAARSLRFMVHPSCAGAVF